MSTLRVVQIVPDPRVGGPQIRIALVANALRAQGVETTVVVPPGPAADYFASQGVRCVPVSFPRPRRLSILASLARTSFGAPYDVVRLARVIRQQRAAIVHVNGIMTINGVLASRAAGTRCVWHMNDTQTPPALYGGILRAAQRARLCDRVIFSARAVAEHAGLPCTPDDVVGAPVDVGRFQPRSALNVEVLARHYLDATIPTVVMVGHVNVIKGHVDLVDAIWHLRRRGVSVQALCVGSAVDADATAAVSERIEQRKLEAWFRLAGPSTQPEEYLAAATLSVLPSHTEAMPMALLEAMAAGLPCVSTRVGGVAEVIEDGVSGLLVPTRQPERLADAIGTLLGDPDRAARMGAAARRATLAFAVERVAERQAKIYRAVAG